MEEKKCKLLVIVGPTASGKTKLAVELAKIYHGEVVSADSMQIYKGMDIATAKPTSEEMEGIPHHLMDFLSPDEASFSVADYAQLARQTISEISQRGHLPILAGGTGLYIKAIVDNVEYAEIQSDPVLRLRLREQAQTLGNEVMLERLRQIDPDLAAGLHPNNLNRILRALEVYELTGIPMSEHQRKSRLVPAPYQICMLGLTCQDRQKLYQRINQRVDLMMERGLLEEAREIERIYQGTARQAIGYKELAPYLHGQEPLELCVEKLKQATRNYAKRQLTWFSRDQRIQWLFTDTFVDSCQLLEKSKNLVHNQLFL